MNGPLDEIPVADTGVQDANSTRQQVQGLQPRVANLMYDALMLDAGLRQSLVAVRSLGSRGLRVAALETFRAADVPSPARTFLDFCVSFFIPVRYDYADWRDPLPICTAVTGFGRNIPRYLEKISKKQSGGKAGTSRSDHA